MYHSVNDTPIGIPSLSVTTKEFEEQMKYISENNYTPIFLSEIENAKKYLKPIIVTLDDGYVDNYTEAYPILKKYNIKANIFVISGSMDGSYIMSKEMIKELDISGLIEIGAHTVRHIALGNFDYETQKNEIVDSGEYLSQLLGKKVNTIAYPYESYNNDTVSITSDYYSFAVTTNLGINDSNNYSTYLLKRQRINRGMNLNVFKSKI